MAAQDSSNSNLKNKGFHCALACVLLSLATCTSKRDVTEQTPMLARSYQGDYQAAAACTLDGIQTGDYTISPNVNYVPVPSEGYVEIQTTATSGMTGTIYGAITRFEELSDTKFRVIVKAAYTGDGDVAIRALTNCVDEKNNLQPAQG